MQKITFSNLVVILALVLMAALTVGQAAAADRLATAAAAPWSPASSQAGEGCAAGGERPSIHMVYVERLSSWVPYTQDIPVGMEGGLIQFFNERGLCFRSGGLK